MRESFLRVLGLTALCFTAMARADVDAPAPATDVIQARWVARSIPFGYASMTVRYNCTALESKIRNILIAIGGHPSTRVRAVGCQGTRQSRVIRLDITTAVPRPATERRSSQVIEREKLLARLGVQQELPQGLFPARQQRVRLSKASLGLAAADCELLTQLREQVFPRLGVTVVDKDKLYCSPYQLSSAPPRFNVMALLPSNDAVIPDRSETIEQ